MNFYTEIYGVREADTQQSLSYAMTHVALYLALTTLDTELCVTPISAADSQNKIKSGDLGKDTDWKYLEG